MYVVCPFGSYDWVCNATEKCFQCEDAAHSSRHPNDDDPDCATCRLRSLQIGPSCRGQARNGIAPRGTAEQNSWEKGFALDHRGIPYRDDATGAMIPVKKFAEKRHAYEESIRANHNGVAVSN